MVHFFTLGALLFVAHHLLASDPRTILVTPGLKSDLARGFQDKTGRAPNPEELNALLQEWKLDEALFREALERELDQDDGSIRGVLVGKMREVAALEVSVPPPTDAELTSWLASHSARYETPLRYRFEFIAFPKTEGDAQRERESFEASIGQGTAPAKLGRPVVGANLSVSAMEGKIPSELAARIPHLPENKWERIDTEQALLLAQVKGKDGGLPKFEELRERLVFDWSSAERNKATDDLLAETMQLYHFESRP